MKKTAVLLLLVVFLSFALVLTACNDTHTPSGDHGSTDGGNTEDGGNEGGNTEGGDTEGGNTEGGDNEGGNTEGGDTEGGNTGEGGDTGEGGNEGGNTPLPACATPVLTWSAGTETLSWQAVEGARAYLVTVNGTALGETAETSMKITKDGTYRITVKALAGDGYTDSAASAVKTVTVGWSGTVK